MTNGPTLIGPSDPVQNGQQLTVEPIVVGSTDIDQDDQLLKTLAPLWKNHHRRDLELRRKTGALLNERLRSPEIRQPHGQKVLKKVEEKLNISESDLNRMRWFAFHFKSVKDLHREYPKVNSWTKVKSLLSKLRTPDHGSEETNGEQNTGDGARGRSSGSGAGKTGSSPGNAVVGGRRSPDDKNSVALENFLRSVETATSEFRQIALPLEDTMRQRALGAIQQLVAAVASPLNALLRFEPLEDVQTPAPPGSDPVN
jgi:hypothetical protein